MKDASPSRAGPGTSIFPTRSSVRRLPPRILQSKPPMDTSSSGGMTEAPGFGVIDPSKTPAEGNVAETSVDQQAVIQAVNAARIEGILVGLGLSVGAYILYQFIK